MELGKVVYFKFAGQKIKGKLLEISKHKDGLILYKFTDGSYIYPIKKEQICGNSTQ